MLIAFFIFVLAQMGDSGRDMLRSSTSGIGEIE